LVDVKGLSQEEFDDFAAGLSYAIRVLREKAKVADDALLSQRAIDYNEYLKKFTRAQTLSELVAELEDLKKTRRDKI